MLLSSPRYTDIILPRKGRFNEVFSMDRIIALRNDASEGENYMDLLDDLLKTVVGATKFKENRCKKHLSE